MSGDATARRGGRGRGLGEGAALAEGARGAAAVLGDGVALPVGKGELPAGGEACGRVGLTLGAGAGVGLGGVVGLSELETFAARLAPDEAVLCVSGPADAFKTGKEPNAWMQIRRTTPAQARDGAGRCGILRLALRPAGAPTGSRNHAVSLGPPCTLLPSQSVTSERCRLSTACGRCQANSCCRRTLRGPCGDATSDSIYRAFSQTDASCSG